MSNAETVNMLAMATVAGSQAGELINRLTRDGFHATRIDASGGVIEESTVSLLIGFGRDRQSNLLEHIRGTCRAYRQFLPASPDAPFSQVPPMMVEARAGGAMIHLFEVEHFEQI